MKLRPYQRECMEALYSFWSKAQGKNPVLCLPTGAGKSHIIAQIIKDVVNYGEKVLVLSHVKELLEQNMSKAQALCPEANMTYYCAGLKQKDLRGNVVFASIQSVYKNVHKGDAYAVVVIDECHLISRKVQSMYGQAIDMLKKMNPLVKFVGTTATPYRLNSGYLYEGKDALFDGLAYEITISKLIKEGFLCNAISKGGIEKIDLTNIKKRAGEFREEDLAFAASDDRLVKYSVEEIIKYGELRETWLVFCVNIAHAEKVEKEFKKNGIEASLITGETPAEERAQLLRDYKAKKIKCLVNCKVLTTGIDVPNIDLIALITATESTSLFVQMCGRGLRLAENKTDCLILDYGNNFERHGVLDNIQPKIKNSNQDKKSDCPVRECPKCRTKIQISLRECPECGYEFPEPKFNHNTKAYSGAILSEQLKGDYQDVQSVRYMQHCSRNGKPCIKIEYLCNNNKMFNFFLCPEHGGYALTKFLKWVLDNGGKAKNIKKFLEECKLYPVPSQIKVRKQVSNPKYWEVIGAVYE